MYITISNHLIVWGFVIYSKTATLKKTNNWVSRPNYRVMQVKSIAECSKGSILQYYGEHSAILLTFIKLPFDIKIFVLSIFEWPFYKCVKRRYYGVKGFVRMSCWIREIMCVHYRPVSSWASLFQCNCQKNPSDLISNQFIIVSTSYENPYSNLHSLVSLHYLST